MRLVIIMMLATSAVACAANTPAPQDQFAAAQNQIGRAQESGASNVPDARLHLRLASEGLSKAKSLFGEQNDYAASLIARANAEAVLALDLANEARARAAAQEASDAVVKARGMPGPVN